MRKILIITPHYPPSNLASVHRSRLFAQHLPLFGWYPVILTVDEKHYEEAPDRHLERLLPPGQRIEKVGAYGLTKPRLIGDLGLRSFFQLRKKAVQIIRSEKIDFVYIPIPSFYVSLLGPYLHRKTGVKYGIDYIDPWVHHFPGSDKPFSRHWWSTKLSAWLEPKAVKTASLITGVAEGYYKGVLERNPGLKASCLFGAMPYGGEERDHDGIRSLGLKPYLFSGGGKRKLVYAGAMLPKAYGPLEEMFKAISEKREEYKDIEFHFIGTGKTPGDENGYNIRPYAEKYGLWKTIVFEYPKRIPYLDVLVHLAAGDAVFILGSTEKHYTPSKTYQGILTKKPILAILHEESSAVNVLNSTGAGKVLSFRGEGGVTTIQHDFNDFFKNFRSFWNTFNPASVKREAFEPFSAREVTRQLALLLDQLL